MDKQTERALIDLGNSRGITIPAKMLYALEAKENNKEIQAFMLTLDLSNGWIVLKPKFENEIKDCKIAAGYQPQTANLQQQSPKEATAT